MFKIMIQDPKDNQKWYMLRVKKENTTTKVEEVTDPETNEVKNVTTEVGTGTYSSVEYYTDDPVEYEKKCIELLKTYNLSQLKFIDEKEYGVDLLWNLDNQDVIT